MAKGLNTTIDNLRAALIIAARKPEVEGARAAWNDASGSDVDDASFEYWTALAAATYAELPAGVRRVIGRKLVPGLREANLELRRLAKKVVTFHVDGEDALQKVTLDDAAEHPLTCTNCGAEYPDDAERCPGCGER